MGVLYGRHYRARYRVIADLIPPFASVLELCCGPAILYDKYLREKAVEYRGIDINDRFIRDLARRGIRGDLWDLRDMQAFPGADYIIMQASLYHFLPNASVMIDRMLDAARKQVIIAEPIVNLASAKMPIIAYVARTLTNPGVGSHESRFVEKTLDELAERYGKLLRRSFLAPGGREKIYIFEKNSLSERNGGI